MPIAKEDTEAILRKLNEKGVSSVCPRCPPGSLALFEGFFAPVVSLNAREVGQIVGEKHALPCIALVCRNCGFTALHSLEVLGLMNVFQR